MHANKYHINHGAIREQGWRAKKSSRLPLVNSGLVSGLDSIGLLAFYTLP